MFHVSTRFDTMGGMAESTGHFGEYLRWMRTQANQTTEEFGEAIGVSARRLVAIELMPEPVVQHRTLIAIAKAMKLSLAELDHAWRTTPVTVTRRKAGPTNTEARLYARACERAGVSLAEGMRHVRSWLVTQDEATQVAALRFTKSSESDEAGFSGLVDHVQDPAEATRDRVGRTASAAKPQGSAATGESKRR